MKKCCNLYLLSTIACQLVECLSSEDASILSSDLVVLSDMMANLITRDKACEEKTQDTSDDEEECVVKKC